MFRDRIRPLLVLASVAATMIACTPLAEIAKDPARDEDSGESCPDGRAPLASCEDGRVTLGCCPTGALCSPPASYCDLGNGACVAGPTCTVDAGAHADAARSDADAEAGTCPDGRAAMASCDQGLVTLGCCPTGAHCSPPASYCDFGDGTCVVETSCPADAGPDAFVAP